MVVPQQPQAATTKVHQETKDKLIIRLLQHQVQMKMENSCKQQINKKFLPNNNFMKKPWKD
jgi:hypothetical protein